MYTSPTISIVKWYRKPWGIILLLLLFFPIGLYLLWTYPEWSKKSKWIITGVTVVYVITMNQLFPSPRQPIQSNPSSSTVSEQVSEPQAEVNTDSETTNNEQSEEIQPEPTIALTFQESELTDTLVRDELGKVTGLSVMAVSELTSIRILDNGGTEDIEDDKIVELTYKPESVWDEKDIVQMTAMTMASVAEKLFQHPKIGFVRVVSQGDFTDQYGQTETSNAVRVGLKRSTAEKINWETFKDMVIVDYTKLFDIAEEQWMRLAI